MLHESTPGHYIAFRSKSFLIVICVPLQADRVFFVDCRPNVALVSDVSEAQQDQEPETINEVDSSLHQEISQELDELADKTEL